MEPESLVKLVGSGNTATVEDEWMRLLEAPDLSVANLTRYQVVLGELCKVGKGPFAEQLAWAAVEAVREVLTPLDAERIAGAFLLTIGDSADLRVQVADLYREAYADREGIDVLLAESGLRAGRPVRRALRTLEVCLPLSEGSFLISRDGESAARVDRIDRAAWWFTIAHAEGEETLPAVNLADRYEPAPPRDFRVLRQFSPAELADRLAKDPGAVVIDLCRRLGNRIDSEKLESMFVPAPFTESEWKTWFSKARSALKNSPNVKIEGRSPYTITYVEVPRTLEAPFLAEFQEQTDVVRQLSALDRYLRECKARRQPPAPDVLAACYRQLHDRAARWNPPSALEAGLTWLAARRVGETAGIPDASAGAIQWFQSLDQPSAILYHVEDQTLLQLACSSFIEARPHDWQDQLLQLLPGLPLEMCDAIATRLVKAGRGSQDFEPAIQRVLSAPVAHFDALLWLWDGPAEGESVASLPPLSILTRILRTLEECRRSDQISKEAAKRIAHRARIILGARKYERFLRCLDTIDASMAAALRAQLQRLENLHRSARDELLDLLRRRFPAAEPARAALQPWSREDVLYVTDQGLAKKQAEIEHHVNVKMKENARAIGAAAEHGDLSENSEYKFALEERDLLRARLAQMNAEVAMARVLSLDDVPTEHVGIGSKVNFRRVDNGHAYQITFVGPWEADASKGWFNYRAPLAQEVLGKRIGDQVEFNHSGVHGTYEIVGIQNGLRTQEPVELVV